MALLMCGTWGNNLMHGVQFVKGFIFFVVLLMHGDLICCSSFVAWGSTFKLLVLGLVLLMHGVATHKLFAIFLDFVKACWTSYLEVQGQEVRSYSRFFLLGGVLLICGGGNSITWWLLWLFWCVASTTNKSFVFIVVMSLFDFFLFMWLCWYGEEPTKMC